MSHTSDPPIFSSTCIHTCLCTGFVLVRGSFCSGVCLGYFCLEGFVRGGACPSPFCQNTFHYNRKLIITFNFRFHTYEIFLKCDVTCSWTPSPCQKLSHLLGPLPPSSVTYFMDGLPESMSRSVIIGLQYKSNL